MRDEILRAWVEGAEGTVRHVEKRSVEVAREFERRTVESQGVNPPPESPPSAGIGMLPEPDEVYLPSVREGVRQLQAKRIVSPAEYYELASSAKQQAFTISGELTQDAVEIARDKIAEAIALGIPREEAVESLKVLPLTEAHLEMVFRNAANEAYSQGMEKVLADPMVEDGFPYRAYDAIHDQRARWQHVALETSGLDRTNVYHATDPSWLRFKPPWGFNCRCSWTPITVRQAARMGVKEAQQWLDTGVEPEHVPVPRPPFDPDPAWERQ